VRLDVTHVDEIQAVAAQLSREGTRLYAIINNAGIVVGGPLLTLAECDLRDCLEVNTLGPFNVVRALYPLLDADGCIVNISTIGARYTTPWLGPYHMSKVALEAYNDALRQELWPFGIRVVAIEPGATRTQAFAKWGRLLRNLQGTVYEAAFNRYWAMIQQKHKHALDPSEIAAVVLEVLRTPSPRKRYLVPHLPIVRAAILLSKLGLLDHIYRRYLRDVPNIPPEAFVDSSRKGAVEQ
jgi:NAD(P)-dependent dehydrogenase (short-subunit alcohol dehydrogenase family)